MNRYECDILNILAEHPCSSQRELAAASAYSLGTVNRAVKTLTESGFLDRELQPAEKAELALRRHAPRAAVILAAGFGMRMIPINREQPKPLLEVRGEVLIERMIRQLQEAGINDIYIVVGFMKEQFEYLIDKYHVRLIVNREYYRKNNLFSLRLAVDRLSNCYIIPADLWCEENPFRRHELYSWYMVSDARDSESDIRVSRSLELVASGREPGNRMVGICYLTEPECDYVQARIKALCEEGSSNLFWESALYRSGGLAVQARMVSDADYTELNTYEQLREFDSSSPHLQSDTLSLISRCLSVPPEELTGISVLKKGMTNRSFLFSCRGEQYIMRIPGEGTEKLIDRQQEADVYAVLAGRGISDEVIFMDPSNGCKLTRYIRDARVCDPFSEKDTAACMAALRRLHELRLSVAHEFDIFGRMEYYESLWNGEPSAYRDYAETKRNVLSLRPYIEANAAEKVLTHIDAVPDNFLFFRRDGQEEIRLIDWEYAGMQDPHADIAMFCVYSMYNREQADRLIDQYFTEGCPHHTRIKIYCYIAACGLLWSNWCEYKQSLGVEFGEYSLMQYRFAKDFYRIAAAEISRMGEEENV